MALVAAAFPARPTAEWLARLHAEGVPAAPILTVDRVLADPQVRHRQMVVELIHPTHGSVPTLGTPIKVDGGMGLTPTPPPRLGEHTNEVLTCLLAYPEARVRELRATGVVA
jgi:CoA:oxalate CoA-transferase